jgi:hypothetical protein
MMNMFDGRMMPSVTNIYQGRGCSTVLNMLNKEEGAS